MADVPLRREASRHPFAALTIAVLACSSGACASLLDLPSDPHVAEDGEEAAGLGTDARAGEPESGSLDADGSEANSGGPTGSASTGGEVMGPNPGVTNSRGSVVPTSGSSSASGPGSAPSAAEAEIDGPVPEVVDAGSDARAPGPEAPAPLVACAEGETLGPRGSCYFAVSPRLSWVNARQNCRDRGAGWDLAAILSAADNRVVGELISDETWMGASDAALEGTWRWVIDDTPFWRGTASGAALDGAFETWNSDEPNGGATSDCARAVPRTPPQASGPTWADFECEELLASLCEGPAQ